MKPLSPEVHALLGADSATLALTWTISPKAGPHIRLTNHDAAVSVDGEMFLPGGLGEIEHSHDAVDRDVTVNVTGVLQADAFTEEALDAGRFDGAAVRIALIDWAQQRHLTDLFVGSIHDVHWHDGTLHAALRGVSAALDQPVGRVVSRHCDAVLGDERCRVGSHRPSWRVMGVVVGVDVEGRLGVAGLESIADDWFIGGQLQVGAKSGFVHAHTRIGSVDWFALDLALAAPTIGASVQITAHCDKAFATCKEKFANSENFRGFPHLVGPDALIQGVDPSAPRDGASRWHR